jgi:arsenate reductase (glutaredoxin)
MKTNTSIYGIKNCNTMQKAMEMLKNQKVTFDFNDYKKSGIAPEKIDQWFSQENWEKFINKNGTTFKKLSDEEKAAVTNAASAKALMLKYNSLIKRPILEYNNRLIIGLDDTVYITLK